MTTTRPPRPPAVRPRPAELVLPVAGLAVAAVLPFAYGGRLPDPVASHWGFGGVPDGNLPIPVDHLVLLAATLLVALGPLLAAARADRAAARVLVGLAHGGAALFALLRWWTLEANADAATWRDAGPLLAGDVLVALGVGVAAGLLGAWLARTRPEHPPATRTVAPVPVAPGDHVVWIGRQTAGPALVVPAVAVVVAAVLVAIVPGPAAVVVPALVVAAVALATFTRVAVDVSDRGLSVRLGPFGWPRIRVPLAEVTSVAVQHVEPMAHGGWGYRAMPEVRAVVVRRGEGLRVGRRGRADLVVTVDGAEDAAAVLTALIPPR